MPVPEGIITTTEVLQAVVPTEPEPEVEVIEEETEDDKPV